MTLVECVYCGWVHFAISRIKAEEEVKRFNEYYSELSPKEKHEYYGGKNANIRNYLYCGFCGKEANMKFATKDIYGSTINPIIWEPKIHENSTNDKK